MTVTTVVLSDRTYEIGGVGYEPKGGFSIDGREADPAANAVLMRVTRAALLCNDAALRQTGAGWVVDGDPMEGALVAFGLKAGHEQRKLDKELPRIDEIPFDAAHRYMATLHRGHDGTAFACIKGAPERILDMCSRQATSHGDAVLDRDFWLKAIETLAAQGRRVLAFASRPIAAGKRELGFADVEQGLTLEGIVGISIRLGPRPLPPSPNATAPASA